MAIPSVDKKRITITFTVIFSILLVFILGSLELKDPEELLNPSEYTPKVETKSTKDSGIVKFIDTHIRAKSEKSTQENFVELVEGIGELEGTYSVYIKDLSSDKIYSHNEKQVYYTASLYKVPIAIAVMKEMEIGTISLNSKIEYKEADYFDGTGIINTGKYGIEYSVVDLLNALLKHSDNTAQNMLLRLVGQAKVTSAIFAYLEDDNKSKFASENISSPEEFGIYMEKMLEDGYITDESKEYLLELMSDTAFDDRISDRLERNKSFAHKIGNWPETSSWHDCGVITSGDTHIILCLMSQDTSFEEFLVAGKSVADFINKTY